MSINTFHFPILWGSRFNLNEFDFSFKELAIYDIQSQEFETYIEGLNPEHPGLNLRWFLDIKNKIRSACDKRYAIVSLDLYGDNTWDDFMNVWKLLLIVFPSDLQIEYIVSFEENEGFVQISKLKKIELVWTGGYPGELLEADHRLKNEVNEFFKRCWDRTAKHQWMTFLVDNYLTSLAQPYLHTQFVSLAISLESIIFNPSRQDIGLKFRKIASFLCGKNSTEGTTIFENMRKVYELRGDIVHGETYDDEKLAIYTPVLQSTVSRAIIELMIYDFHSKEDFNNNFQTGGLKRKSQSNSNWKNYILNLTTRASMLTELV